MYAARVKFYGQEKGGRHIQPRPGYRPQLKIGGAHTSCTISIDDSSIVMFDFDQEYDVKLQLMFQDHYEGILSVGDSVKFYEGSRKIGEGLIT